MKLLDVVLTLEAIEDIPLGSIGTIVHVNSPTSFEVEFCKEEAPYCLGKKLTYCIDESQLEKEE